MIAVISPAKSLDLSEESRYTSTHTQPRHIEDSKILVKDLAKMKVGQLESLMDISENLAELNYTRYQNFNFPFNIGNAKQALLTFDGDVYKSFELDTYSEEEFAFAQDHLRILSGLYGLLRPLDLIQPYRLEMGTSMKNPRGKNLYNFWGDKIAHALNEDLKAIGTKHLINLASQEYFKSVNEESLDATILTPNFKEKRDGEYQTIAIYAKQARGSMCDFIIKEKIDKPEGLKDFQGMGYAYNPEISSEKEWVFTRKS